MGNYNFKVNNPPVNGSMVRIIQDKFSTDEEIPDDVLGTGLVGKVINTHDLYQSRPNAPKITVSKVLLKDKNGNTYTEAFFTTNLQPLNK